MWGPRSAFDEGIGIMKPHRLARAAFALLVTATVGAPIAQASELVRADSATAFLDVASEPSARIMIDDADTGQSTPQERLALSPGHHVLTLVTPDGAHKRTIGFTVEAGSTKRLRVHFAS